MRLCALCGKTTKIGMDTTHKHGGQWAMRAPKTRKIWKPNLQVAKVEIEGVGVKRMRFCVKCLRQIKSGDKQVSGQMVPIKNEKESPTAAETA